MATIASISVSLLCKTRDYEKGLLRSRKSLKTFQQSVQYNQRNIKAVLEKGRKDWWAYHSNLSKVVTGLKVGLAVGAVGAAYALTRLVKRQLEEVDMLAKTSRRLGIAVNDLHEFSYAARLSGIQTRTFAMALQRMIRRVAEAASGTGEAQAALKELGLQARSLNLVGPRESLLQVATALSNIQSETDQVRLAFKMFDSEGVAMIQMLKEGRGALEAMMAAAPGKILEEEARRIEQFNDMMTRMKAQTEATARTFAVDFADGIKEGAKQLDNLRKVFTVFARDAGKGRGDVLFKPIGELWGQIQLALADSRDRVKDIEEAMRRQRESGYTATGAVEVLKARRGEMEEVAGERDRLAALQKRRQAEAAWRAETKGYYADLDKIVKQQQEALERVGKTQDDIAIATMRRAYEDKAIARSSLEHLQTIITERQELEKQLEVTEKRRQAEARMVAERQQAEAQIEAGLNAQAASIKEWLKTAEERLADFRDTLLKLWENRRLEMPDLVLAMRKREQELAPPETRIPDLAAFESRFRQTAPGGENKSEQYLADLVKSNKEIVKAVKPRIGGRPGIPIVGLN